MQVSCSKAMALLCLLVINPSKFFYLFVTLLESGVVRFFLQLLKGFCPLAVDSRDKLRVRAVVVLIPIVRIPLRIVKFCLSVKLLCLSRGSHCRCRRLTAGNGN